jgi:hypothetical protein
MADIETLQEQDEQPYHIVLRTGQAISIRAQRFEHQVNSEDLLRFYDANGQVNDQVFLRASAVDCVIPQSAIVEASPFIEIHKRLDDHEARLRDMERALAWTQAPPEPE